jgi:hypothetical protein
MIDSRELRTGLVLRLGVLLLRAAIAPLAVAAFGGVASAESTSSLSRVERVSAPAIADAFNQAIVRGDAAAARALLMPGVLIFESGDAELSADEYARHHLLADINFMAAMSIEQLSRNSGGDQSTSWVATKSRIRGHYNGKVVDLDSTETLVLSLTNMNWRIVHIHWSSSPHRSGANTH